MRKGYSLANKQISLADFLPIHVEKPQQALPLLQEAKALLPSSSHPMIRSWLVLIEAEAVSHLRDETACENALAYAETMYEQPGSEEEALWTQLNDASLPGSQGACSPQLHSSAKSLDVLQDHVSRGTNFFFQ